nr:Chain C, peptide from HLA-DPA1 protein [synthetic construct]
EEFGAAASF